ncbi:MAG: VCBS repeat-containing protein [SAR202 cluster bacterium]|nr:VCBS repeat-containing protein [SAR202 cluster bacterium]
MNEFIKFEERLIGDGYNYTIGVSAVDLTGTGSLDLVSTDTDVGLYWYENDGKGNFVKHVVHERSNEWLERHAIADINGDGKPEIVTIDNINGSVLWFEFDGDPRDAASWSQHYICHEDLPGAYDVAVSDYDGDGEMEIVASSWVKGNMFAYFDRQDGEWVKSIVDEGVKETRMVRAVDMNGNGRPDFIGTASGSDLLAWYENPGDPYNHTWPRHIIDTPKRPNKGQPVDMDGDGGLDLVMAIRGDDSVKGVLETPGAQIVWYERMGPDSWTKHVIADEFHQASEAVAADVDGDGQMEVVATAWGANGRVALFKHRGDPRGPWDMQILKSPWSKAAQPIIVDLDGDGLLDIVACAERGSNELRWWRNLGPA